MVTLTANREGALCCPCFYGFIDRGIFYAVGADVTIFGIHFVTPLLAVPGVAAPGAVIFYTDFLFGMVIYYTNF